LKAESNIKPNAPFKIEPIGDMANIRFYTDITKKDKEITEEDNTEIWEYNEYLLTGIRNRPGLKETIEKNYDQWLQLAIDKEKEPKPETEREKILRLEKENKLLGIEISEREIQEIILGQQISELEIQLLELQIGGM